MSRLVEITKVNGEYQVNPNATPSGEITNIITQGFPCFAFTAINPYGDELMLVIKSNGEVITDINDIPTADFIIDIATGGGSATEIYRKDSSSVPDDGEYVSSATYYDDNDFTVTNDTITLIKDNQSYVCDITAGYSYKLIDRAILPGS